MSVFNKSTVYPKRLHVYVVVAVSLVLWWSVSRCCKFTTRHLDANVNRPITWRMTVFFSLSSSHHRCFDYWRAAHSSGLSLNKVSCRVENAVWQGPGRRLGGVGTARGRSARAHLGAHRAHARPSGILYFISFIAFPRCFILIIYFIFFVVAAAKWPRTQ